MSRSRGIESNPKGSWVLLELVAETGKFRLGKFGYSDFHAASCSFWFVSAIEMTKSGTLETPDEAYCDDMIGEVISRFLCLAIMLCVVR